MTLAPAALRLSTSTATLSRESGYPSPFSGSIVFVSKPTTAMSPSSGADGNSESVARRWKPAKTSALSPIAANPVTAAVSARIETIRRISSRRFRVHLQVEDRRAGPAK